MASKTLLFFLGLTLIAVAYGAWVLEEEEEIADLTEHEEELTVEDLLEYFTPMEKRGRKGKGRGVGSCTRPDGKQCDVCNLKIKNKNDMRRYIACTSAGKGRKI